ncbi:hypothetical protein EVAR_50073_1 [Eumeta japonica]|uniref:Uncharacterized protein n=1 Tax=Eumeta variegata TaxID=151549 RepID=A0A4C1XJH3_EUMVA|nr:hypothetical protein EVAR_50073_1 [Eumeta japonica]
MREERRVRRGGRATSREASSHPLGGPLRFSCSPYTFYARSWGTVWGEPRLARVAPRTPCRFLSDHVHVLMTSLIKKRLNLTLWADSTEAL